MKTIIGKEEYIEEAARLLRDGKLVAFPTETVYGLGADALNPEAVSSIYVAKGRPSDNPLIVHLADYAQLHEVAVDVPPLAKVLYDRFCPGPLTLILPKHPSIPSVVSAGLATVGVRFPSHPMARALLQKCGPIAAPSANASKHVSPTTAAHVYDDLQGRIPLILDGGSCAVGIESTILDLTQEIPTILRPGAITKEMLAEICLVATHSGEVKVALAPGMKYIHYSPRCDSVMCPPSKIPAIWKESREKGLAAVVIAREQTLASVGECESISLGKEDGEVMRNLYSALRSAEREYDLIILEELPEEGLLYSVMNRAKKSVQHHE